MLKLISVLIAIAFSLSTQAAEKGYSLFDKNEPNTERATKLEAPKLVSPENLSRISGTATKLQWQPVEGAKWYKVLVATDPYFRFRIADSYVEETSFNVEGLEAGQSYYWKVIAGDSEKMAGATIGHGAVANFDVQ